jgi:hypothetical protein
MATDSCPQCTGPVVGGICTVCGLEIQAVIDAVNNNARILAERDAAQKSIDDSLQPFGITRRAPLDGRGWGLTGLWIRKHTEFLRFKHPSGICVLSGVEERDGGGHWFVLLVYVGIKERANRHVIRKVQADFDLRTASEVVGWEGPVHLRALRRIVKVGT